MPHAGRQEKEVEKQREGMQKARHMPTHHEAGGFRHVLCLPAHVWEGTTGMVAAASGEGMFVISHPPVPVQVPHPSSSPVNPVPVPSCKKCMKNGGRGDGQEGSSKEGMYTTSLCCYSTCRAVAGMTGMELQCSCATPQQPKLGRSCCLRF